MICSNERAFLAHRTTANEHASTKRGGGVLRRVVGVRAWAVSEPSGLARDSPGFWRLQQRGRFREITRGTRTLQDAHA